MNVAHVCRGKVTDALYAALASEEESQPLLYAATTAAQPPPKPNAQDLGRGKRKRPEHGSLAEGRMCKQQTGARSSSGAEHVVSKR